MARETELKGEGATAGMGCEVVGNAMRAAEGTEATEGPAALCGPQQRLQWIGWRLDAGVFRGGMRVEKGSTGLRRCDRETRFLRAEYLEEYVGDVLMGNGFCASRKPDGGGVAAST